MILRVLFINELILLELDPSGFVNFSIPDGTPDPIR